ncbi:MAG: hypothetical protein DYG89_37935 [Caldilinea sp. CFX5]|nr:hypothetical protein [Caldilinea sp. CFX5]
MRLQEEIIEFLARGPSPEEIVAFRPSAQAVNDIQQLLTKNHATRLTAAEEAELDQAEWLDNLMTRIKAHARLHCRKISKLRARAT